MILDTHGKTGINDSRESLQFTLLFKQYAFNLHSAKGQKASFLADRFSDCENMYPGHRQGLRTILAYRCEYRPHTFLY